MSNPFNGENARYVVLVNAEDQYSFWPTSIAVPAGWRVVFGEAEFGPCAEYIAENWTDMRPRSLVKQLRQTP
ncbi:MAG: MbtH family protein [Dactylosporangium sp.]|nr:MbtH family protein [Dactylosporangium sp.]NNJ61943.1 MbtH family protein [Dactylosporangium sp.]